MILFFVGMVVGFLVGLTVALWMFDRMITRMEVEAIITDIKTHEITSHDVIQEFELMKALCQ